MVLVDDGLVLSGPGPSLMISEVVVLWAAGGGSAVFGHRFIQSRLHANSLALCMNGMSLFVHVGHAVRLAAGQFSTAASEV